MSSMSVTKPGPKLACNVVFDNGSTTAIPQDKHPVIKRITIISPDEPAEVELVSGQTVNAKIARVNKKTADLDMQGVEGISKIRCRNNLVGVMTVQIFK